MSGRLPMLAVERSLWIGWAVLLLVTVLLALRIKPDESARLLAPLASLVPTRFGEWQSHEGEMLPIVNPQLEESLKTAYDDLLNRTYVNALTGRAIMLSVSHGSDQGHRNQAHKPEVCYPAQGFAIDGAARSEMSVAGQAIPITTFHAQKGSRSEYVTYWLTAGDRVVRGAWGQNLRRIANAFQGRVAGGMIIRISEVTTDGQDSKRVQAAFAQELIAAMPAATRRQFGIATR